MKLENLKKIKKPSLLEKRLPKLKKEYKVLKNLDVRPERREEILASIKYIYSRLGK